MLLINAAIDRANASSIEERCCPLLTPGQKLADAYMEANLPVVRRRLYQASIRLAWVLNESFPGE